MRAGCARSRSDAVWLGGARSFSHFGLTARKRVTSCSGPPSTSGAQESRQLSKVQLVSQSIWTYLDYGGQARSVACSYSYYLGTVSCLPLSFLCTQREALAAETGILRMHLDRQELRQQAVNPTNPVAACLVVPNELEIAAASPNGERVNSLLKKGANPNEGAPLIIGRPISFCSGCHLPGSPLCTA